MAAERPRRTRRHPLLLRSGKIPAAYWPNSLIYDVFQRHDPDNLLLQQARSEVLEAHFQRTRLARALSRLKDSRLSLQKPDRPTPLAFPLLVDRMAARVSSETLLEGIQALKKRWEL
ncbi:MAG TPA: hypothetical protein VLV83_01080 [Acidobacteriota bacterium]|nr:hypothetical protein [Acidobacteriota bacterium]